MTKFFMALGCFGCMCILSMQTISAQSNTQSSTNTQAQTFPNKEDVTKPVSVKSRTVETNNQNVTDQNSKDVNVSTNQETNSSTTQIVKTIVVDGVTKTVISKESMNSQSERGRQYILAHPELYYVEE